MIACQTQANEQCLLVEIPFDVVASTSNGINGLNGIYVVQNGGFTYPFQVAYSTYAGGGTSQLQYWNTTTSTFTSFTPAQYSNVDLDIIINNEDCEYIVMLCPRNQNTAMTVGNQTFEPYYKYYDIVATTTTGDLTLVPDSCFVAPDCVDMPCTTPMNCSM
jgi:hypothetical protein